LFDRGLIAPCKKADINVIDYHHLRILPPTMAFDLPAGGRRLIQKAEGYRATIVSGVVTFEERSTDRCNARHRRESGNSRRRWGALSAWWAVKSVSSGMNVDHGALKGTSEEEVP